MNAFIYRLKSALSCFVLVALAAVIPALAQAQPELGGQPVKALTSNSSGALLVLRDSGLFAIDGHAATEIPLPPSD